MPPKRPNSPFPTEPAAKKQKSLSSNPSTARNRVWAQSPANKAKRADSANVSYHLGKYKQSVEYKNAPDTEKQKLLAAKKQEILEKR